VYYRDPAVAREAELRDQIYALKCMRADGVRSVQFGERKVEFKSDEELAAAINALERELNPQQVRNVMVRPAQNKGW
jgi:hypothetical protein